MEACSPKGMHAQAYAWGSSPVGYVSAYVQEYVCASVPVPWYQAVSVQGLKAMKMFPPAGLARSRLCDRQRRHSVNSLYCMHH